MPLASRRTRLTVAAFTFGVAVRRIDVGLTRASLSRTDG
jgi:hypothetical protein